MNVLPLVIKTQLPVPRPAAPRWRLDAALALALFLASHAVYRASTGTIQQCDSTYSLVVVETLLTAGTPDLRACVPADAATRATMAGYQPALDLPYHLVRRPDPAGPPHVFYGYPLGTAVLALPFVAYDIFRGRSTLGPDGVPDYAAEAEMQARTAARVAAGVVVLFFALARFCCTPLAAGLLAAGFAFGSPVWSTLSRALWSHTGMVAFLSAALVLLAAARRCGSRGMRADLAFGAGLGTALFWAVFCRQHAALSAAAIGVYLLARDRRLFLATVLAGGAWSAALVACSFAAFGTALPPSVYAPGMLDGRDVLERFAWLMASPARGLLVFCPYLAVVAVLLVIRRRSLADAGLLLPAGLAVAAHTVLYSCFSGWHANWAYGPRYFCDVLPWLVLASALAVRGLTPRDAAALTALVLCFGWGMFVHARGANAPAAWHWNDRAKAVGDEAAVKDWRHPQFLAGLTFTVRPDGTVEGR